jgi:hypothetical protein
LASNRVNIDCQLINIMIKYVDKELTLIQPSK